MHVILLALGLIMALAGLVLVAFGIGTNAAALGNTLIVAGMIAIVGGLLLIGLASAIGQLRRIEQALAVRPLPRALGPEPAAPVSDVHTPVVAPAAVAKTRFQPEHPAPPPEPAVEKPPAAAEMPQPAASEKPAEGPPRRPQAQPRSEPMAEKNVDAVWQNEPAAEAERISAIEAEPADAAEAAWAPAGADEVQIFKSGVIDGMAYTLYTDGSIEAELAQGTVKFSSVDELRAYLASRE